MYPETLNISVKTDSIHLTGLSQKVLDEIDKFSHKNWRLVRSETGFILRNAEAKELDSEAKENSLPSKVGKKEASQPNAQECSLDDEVSIAHFTNILCSSPRGRYDLIFGLTKLILNGKTNSFSVDYHHMENFFVVSPTSAAQTQVMVFPRKPVKVGKTAISSIVWEMPNKEKIEVAYNNPSTLNDDAEVISGVASDVFLKILSKFPDVKIQKPLSFHKNSQISGVVCSYKCNSGSIYTTSKGLLFGPKPAVFITLEKVKEMKFPRLDGPSRSFDMEVKLEDGTKFSFDNLDKENGATFVKFINSMNNDEASSSTKTEKRMPEDTSTRRSKRGVAVHYQTTENLDSDSDDDDYNFQSDPLSKKQKIEESDSDENQSGEDTEITNANMDVSQFPSHLADSDDETSDEDVSDEETSEGSGSDGDSEDSGESGDEQEVE